MNKINVSSLAGKIQQLRIYLGEHDNLELNVLLLVKNMLNELLETPKSELDEAEGEIMFLLLTLDTLPPIAGLDAVIKELKYKIVRTFKLEPRFRRGNDNTDIYKDKRDDDGYIVDLNLIVPPYSSNRIVHKTGNVEHFTEEIFIDSLGRYFRKIYPHKDEDSEDDSQEAITEEILSNFEDTKDKLSEEKK